jgi:hypothetical protein
MGSIVSLENEGPECPPGNGSHCFEHGWYCCHCGARQRDLERERAKAEPEPRCEGCGHTEGEGCGCPPQCECGHSRGQHSPALFGTCEKSGCKCLRWRLTALEEPPLTPEEEERIAAKFRDADMEEAPEDPGHDCGNCEGVDPDSCPFNLPPPEGPEYTPCVCGHIVPEHEPHGGLCFVDGCDCCEYRTERQCSEVENCDGNCCAKLPSQPERRAPYVATYSVGGHLYEVAVPGDASLQAVDGALVIRHGLGPVAGLVAFQPMTIEPQKEGQ